MKTNATNLLLLIDSSGSMVEMGRQRLVQRLILQTEEFIKLFDPSVSVQILCMAGSEITPFTGSFQPLGEVKWKLMGAALEPFCSDGAAILLISDGDFRVTHMETMQNLFQEKRCFCAALPIGVGSKHDNLAELVGQQRVFTTAEIWQALALLLLGAAGTH